MDFLTEQRRLAGLEPRYTALSEAKGPKQKRWNCSYCGASGWESGTERISPRFDHDRPDGKRCKKAEKARIAGMQGEAKGSPINFELEQSKNGYFRFHITGKLGGVSFRGRTRTFYPAFQEPSEIRGNMIEVLNREDGKGRVSIITKVKVEKALREKLKSMKKSEWREAKGHQTKRDFVKSVWAKHGVYSVRPIDPDEYPPIRGMEGPFQFKSGRVLYYDPREGRYYDRKTDMYLDRQETP